MNKISPKSQARRVLPNVVYLWLANRYRGLRRLVSYPDTAQVGMTNYDIYWSKKASSGMGQLSDWRLKRAQIFASLVEPGSRVLDLGAGDGAVLRYLIDHKQIAGYGLDISPRAVAFCREHGLNVDLADINRPITDYMHEPFDFIILSEIIEHLPDPESLLNSLRPYARQGIVVSIPNTGFHQHRLRLLFGKFPLQWVVTPGEHLRFWTRTDFHWWARQMRFEIVREYPYQGTRWLKDWWPGLFAAAFVYVLRNTPQAG